MNKFKIEKGISRITRVKLQATIEESIAADLAFLGEWSNNDKNYIVNELLRFVLSQDSGFQAYKESIGTSRPTPRVSGTPPSLRPEQYRRARLSQARQSPALVRCISDGSDLLYSMAAPPLSPSGKVRVFDQVRRRVFSYNGVGGSLPSLTRPLAQG
jgi:hypothetical protein